MVWIIPIIEIFCISLFVNYILSFFWDRYYFDIISLVLVVTTIFAISTRLPLPALHKISVIILSWGSIFLTIIFQPEIRAAISRPKWRKRGDSNLNNFNTFFDALSGSIFKMSKAKIGAIVVITQRHSLQEFSKRAIMVNGTFSPELLESIFSKQSPLHDGAVIISGNTIVSASVILPLADGPHVTKSLKTRHRAAIGITLTTDSIVVVISEETGQVSIVKNGLITKGVNQKHFTKIFKALLYDYRDDSFVKDSQFKKILTKWFRF